LQNFFQHFLLGRPKLAEDITAYLSGRRIVASDPNPLPGILARAEMLLD